MLKEFLVNTSNFRQDQIMSYMFMTKFLDILSVHFWSAVEYQQNLNIFRTTKAQYENNVQALVSLWLMDYLVVEENLPSLNDKEALRNIALRIFPDSMKTFSYKELDPENAFTYVQGGIERMQENMRQTRKKHPLENYDAVFPSSIPGIFVNHLLIKESDFNFDFSFKIEKAIELQDDPSWAGYKILFLETDREYIYFAQ